MARSPDPIDRRKRFYTAVDMARAEQGFVVTLDGRPMRTPGGRRLTAPTAALAGLVAEEWAAQGEFIELGDMFTTRLSYAVIDHGHERRDQTVDELVRYASADLLCYFADHPQSLLEEETERWGPVLAWAETELGLRFVRVSGPIHQPQPEETLAAVGELARALDDFSLGGLAQATGLFGSLVLALALQRDQLDGQAAFELSRVDETFQERQWGVDEEAALRVFHLKAEAVALERWFSALR